MLVSAAIGFAMVALSDLIEAERAYTTWPTVDAVVDEVSAHSIGGNKYGAITVKLRFSTGFGEKWVWAMQSPLASRGSVHKKIRRWNTSQDLA